MTLEDTLFEDIRNERQVDIDRALLIASDCDTEEKIAEYKAKLDELERCFKEFTKDERIKIHMGFMGYTGEKLIAGCLHEFLRYRRPVRYAKDKPLLTEAIDAQLSPETKEVGNCRGLTALYTVMGIRNGLNVAVMYSHNHVMSRVRTKDGVINIENTAFNGFDVELPEPEVIGLPFREANPLLLLAEEYRARGLRNAHNGELVEALTELNKAITAYPKFRSVYFLRGEVKEALFLNAEEDRLRYTELEIEEEIADIIAGKFRSTA